MVKIIRRQQLLVQKKKMLYRCRLILQLENTVTDNKRYGVEKKGRLNVGWEFPVFNIINTHTCGVIVTLVGAQSEL